MEELIREIIQIKGPLTGAELLEQFNEDGLLLWRACKRCKKLTMRTIGTRYLRLDRRIAGFARLSPSIMREFLTYTVIGSSDDLPAIEEKATGIISRIEEISRSKSDLAYHVASTLSSELESKIPIHDQACFILAGDIVYNMGHDVPRPERSTGKLVKGSDMDMVVIVDDQFPKEAMISLDEAIFKEKYRLLIAPHIMEEIDYVVKDLARVREQIRFETFKHRVACKILHEGTLLYGSQRVFETAKSLLKEEGVDKKLTDMEERAKAFRVHAEGVLLREDPQKIRDENIYLFYPTEESEEFE